MVEGGRKRQRCGKLGLVGLVGLPSCRSEAVGSRAGPCAGLLGAVLHAAGQGLRRGLCVSQMWEMLPAVPQQVLHLRSLLELQWELPSYV